MNKLQKKEWEKLKEKYDNRCVRCGLEDYHLERDHIIPAYQGGLNELKNFQPLCAWCNSSKGPETIDWKHIRDTLGWIDLIITLPKSHPYNKNKK